MGLECGCGFDEDYYDEVWYKPEDFQAFEGFRRKRCMSCGALIDIGSLCIEFTRARRPKTDIEERIYGDGLDIPLASFFHCESCAEIFFNLYELGFCVGPEENMHELMALYRRDIMKNNGLFSL